MSLADWRSITNEKEKYAAYLCSREWAEKREAVRNRSHGICERCKFYKMDACHHLTYERKYHEELSDLQAICKKCHEFTHGKSDADPAILNMRYLTSEIIGCDDYDSHCEEEAISCPVCRDGYQHHDGSEVIVGDDDYKTGTGFRGDAVKVTFHGECGSRWAILFCFHKGNTFTYTELYQACSAGVAQ